MVSSLAKTKDGDERKDQGRFLTLSDLSEWQFWRLWQNEVEFSSRRYRNPTQESHMTEERRHAILFAATLLSARKLLDLDPDKPSMAKQFFVDRAIDDAVFILDRIDSKFPTRQS
jgi:hypothetical protein